MITKIKTGKAHPSHLEPLAERVQILIDELSMATRWNHASLLLAVYQSEYLRQDVEKRLKVRLASIGQKMVAYKIDKERFDVPLALSAHEERAKSTFLVSGLRFGGGKGGNNAYRALNIRRELLIDFDIRAIFWLTLSEAAALPRRAPDFWAFRHRVVEFTDQPSSGKRVEALVAARNRVNLHPENPQTWDSLGKAFLELGRFDESISAFRRATRIDSDFIPAWKNLALVYTEAGRNTEAEHALRKIKRIAPRVNASRRK
jgi:tetratricopeptide (TPR) repeat protein